MLVGLTSTVLDKICQLNKCSKNNKVEECISPKIQKLQNNNFNKHNEGKFIRTPLDEIKISYVYVICLNKQHK